MRGAGVVKRPPAARLALVRDLLMQMSKADLAEIVEDYAFRSIGDEAACLEDPVIVVREIAHTARALALACGRTNRYADRALWQHGERRLED